jgi:prolipoprotein diacylglyceryltransferase
LRVPVHPELHPVFETLAYLGGYAAYKYARWKQGDALTDERRWIVIAAAAVGALLGSRLLGLAEEIPRQGFHIMEHLFGSGGKTIVGGLLGGWLGVELAKHVSGIRSRTGDLFAIPLCLGIAVGRIGCFFAGLADDTYGKPTSLPWGVDFGDGIPRHPTQLYEIGFLATLGILIWLWSRREHAEGTLFRIFLGAYLGWRFVIDFLKPQPLAYGLNVIQWACLAGLLILLANRNQQGTPHDA